MTTEYQLRDQLLKSLGYNTYKDYLNSDLWKDIRIGVFTLKGNICQVCFENNATQIHHTEYDMDTLLGNVMNNLIPICEDCHIYFEFDQDGFKRQLIYVNKIMLPHKNSRGGKKNRLKLKTIVNNYNKGFYTVMKLISIYRSQGFNREQILDYIKEYKNGIISHKRGRFHHFSNI